MKKNIIRVSVLLAVLAAGWGAYRLYSQLQQKQQVIATANVRKGDVIIRSFTRGELRAVRSAMLIAPNLFGTVQVTRLAPLGSFAKEKDLVVEFDDSDVLARVEDEQLELDQLEQEIRKTEAELKIRTNQDQVELLRARYSVRRADLEVKRNELLSAIQAQTNELNLKEANRRLEQLKSDVQSRLEQAKAQLAVLNEKRNKALMDLQRERFRLSQVKLLAPMSGLVAIRQSRPQMFFRGMQLPDIREGDQIFPGTPVADIMDLSELEIVAKVGELDRANLHEGQDVIIQLDAVAGKRFNGKIKTMSGTASANIWSGDPAKKFDVIFSVDMKELLAGLGAKPEHIRQVLETAARNRSKPQIPAMGAPMGGPVGIGGGPELAGAPAMGESGGTMAAGGEGSAGGAGQRVSGGGGSGERVRGGRQGFGGGQMPAADRDKAREAFQKALAGRKMGDLSAEERQKIIEKVRAAVPAAAAGSPGTAKPEAGQTAEASGRARRRGAGERDVSGAGESSGPGGSGGFGGPPVMLGLRSPYTERELAQAKLPPAPEEANQLEVLLRPGLLADVEIIVDKVPNAVHIPVQAVFEKDGKPIVYVKNGSAFDERAIRPLKRSESIMVISEGLKPGEVVALADPQNRNKKSSKQDGAEKKGALPVGGGGAPGAGGGR